MPKQILKFPEGFLWGAATAAHQVEGENRNSDWWVWEHSHRRAEELRNQGKSPEDYYSGVACDSYNRYDEDFALAEHLHHNATRLSIEWARIEPAQGTFDEAELDHYEKVLQSAKYHGLKTFVTLHHYTLPQWFASLGGFVSHDSTDLFTRYALKVAERLHQYVDFWITFNEPEIYISHCYILGLYPPQHTNILTARKAAAQLITAHRHAAARLRHATRRPIGIAHALFDIVPSKFFGSLPAAVAHRFANEYFLNKMVDTSDFIGVNYYVQKAIGWFGVARDNVDVTDLGWAIHPEGLEHLLLFLKGYYKPVYITENGLADARDTKRERFIKDHLYHLHRAVQQGVDVRGYLHWSLVDNFEWAQGFGPRFGLIEIDRDDFLKRKVRYSATKYVEICKTNTLIYESK